MKNNGTKFDYDVGDDVPLSFQVMVNNKPTEPLTAKGYVFNNKSILIFDDKCQIKGSNVSFMVDRKSNTEPGEFTVIYPVELRGLGRKNYVQQYTVHPLPVQKGIRRKMQEKVK